MNIDSVSFGAIPINKVIVKKYNNKTNSFSDFIANFVKIEPNKNDLLAINWTARNWKGAKYIQRIATAAHWMNARDFVEIDVYALTEQNNKFKKLKPTKIIGLVEMRNNCENPKDRIIHHLQVKPTSININNNGLKKHQKIGCGILNSLKKIYNRLSLFSEDNPDIVNFYERNGFIEDFQGENHFSWSSNIFTMLGKRINNFLIKCGFKKFAN